MRHNAWESPAMHSVFFGPQLDDDARRGQLNTSGRTRFSIDFRTKHLGALPSGRRAPNIDSQWTGTTLRDFLRASDRSPFPADVVERFDTPLVAA